MARQTGYQTGSGYDLPPIGSAEIIAREDDSTDFGLPVGYDDPTQYRGKTPQPDRIIGVDRDSRL